jgi:hypothetical protein
MGLISPVKFFFAEYDKAFSLKQTLIYNSNLILFKFRVLSSSYPSHSPELKDQSGHGNLRIEKAVGESSFLAKYSFISLRAAAASLIESHGLSLLSLTASNRLMRRKYSIEN